MLFKGPPSENAFRQGRLEKKCLTEEESLASTHHSRTHCLHQIQSAFGDAGAVAIGADATDDESVAIGLEMMLPPLRPTSSIMAA